MQFVESHVIPSQIAIFLFLEISRILKIFSTDSNAITCIQSNKKKTVLINKEIIKLIIFNKTYRWPRNSKL